jgi:hypothetical protein
VDLNEKVQQYNTLSVNIHLKSCDWLSKIFFKRFQQERSKGRNKGTDQPEHLDKNKDYALTSN